MESAILRPRFGQPCFECGATVSGQRVRILRERAELYQRSFLKSDLLCIDCKKRADEASRGVTVTRPVNR